MRFLLWLMLKWKGGEEHMASMVIVYITLIIAGRRTYESVPGILKDAVKIDMESMGLSTDGKPLTVE